MSLRVGPQGFYAKFCFSGDVLLLSALPACGPGGSFSVGDGPRSPGAVATPMLIIPSMGLSGAFCLFLSFDAFSQVGPLDVWICFTACGPGCQRRRR